MSQKKIEWIVGGLLILVGLLSMKMYISTGLILTVVGLTFLPIFRVVLYKITKTSLTRNGKILFYLLSCWILISNILGLLEQREEARQNEITKAKIEKQQKTRLEQLKKERDKRVAYFALNKKTVLQEIKDLANKKKYQEGLNKVKLYSQTKDKELLALKNDLLAKQKAYEKEKQTKEILAQLKKIPASQLEKNYYLYRDLVKMHPKNSRYQQKLKHYSFKIAEIEGKKIAEQQFYGAKPTQSRWDDSYSAVNQYLKQTMRDPDSLDIDRCSKVYKVENLGWVVGCRYREKNGFGGISVSQNWFIIRQSQVVGIRDENAFSLSQLN